MATFDVLAGRLTIDNTGFLNGLRAAGAAAQQFVANLNRTLRTAQQSIDGITRSINSLKTTASSSSLFNGLGLSASKAEKAAHGLSEALDETKRRLQGVKTAVSDLGKSTAASRTLKQLEEKANGASRAVASLKSRIDGVTAASKRMAQSKLPGPESHGNSKGHANSEGAYKGHSEGEAGRLASDLERSERALGKVGKAFTLVEKMTERGAQWLRSAAESIQKSTKVQQALAGIGLSAAGTSERIEQLGGFLEGFGKASETVATVVEWMRTALELVGPVMLSVATGFTTAGGAAVAFEAAASPLLTVLLPVAAVIGTVVVAIGTLTAAFAFVADSVKKAIESSDAAKASWESITATIARVRDKIKQFISECLEILYGWWKKHEDQIDRVQTKVGELALKVGENLAGAFESVTDTVLPVLKEGLKALEPVIDSLIDAFEAFVDVLGGDWKRAMVLGNKMVINMNTALIALLDSLAKVMDSNAMAIATGGASKLAAKGARSLAQNLKLENMGREIANIGLQAAIEADDKKRQEERDRNRIAKKFDEDIWKPGKALASSAMEKVKSAVENLPKTIADSSGAAANAIVKGKDKALGFVKSLVGGPKKVGQKTTSDQDSAKAESRQQHSDQVHKELSPSEAAKHAEKERQKTIEDAAATSKKSAENRIALLMPISRGEVEDHQKTVDTELPSWGISQKQANINLANDIRANRVADRKDLQGLARRTHGLKGGQQDYALVAEQFKKATQLQIAAMSEQDAERRKMLLQEADERRQAGQAMIKANEAGVKGLKGLTDATVKAGASVKKLDEAEQERLAHEKGQLTPQEQQQQQQVQQFQQQVGDWMKQQAQDAAKQMGQQAWDSGQAMLEQALGGPGQVEDLIHEAAAKGDMKYAVQLLRQRTEAQLQQSLLNLHNLASEPMAGGGFGSSHGGVSNDAYFMTLDIPLVRLIKFLQSQLAALPKMASGGIVSGATAALVGEAGPEAVLPLSSFANMLGSLPVFSNINSAMESISDSLVAQGRTGEANRWDKMLDQVQSSFDYVSNFVENARRIDLRPQGMLRPLTQGMLMDQEMAARNQAYRIGGLTTGDLALHFHGVDISDTGAARQFAQQLLPALELEARSLGQDMTGRSVFRSPSMTGPGMPGRPYGFAR